MLQIRFAADQRETRGLVFDIGKLNGETPHRNRVDGGFKSGDPIKPPLRVDQRLDERLFVFADRIEGPADARGGGVVGFDIITGQQDGAAGQSGFDGIQRNFGFAFGGFRAGR